MKLYALIFNRMVDVEALEKDGYTVIDMTDRCPEGFHYMDIYYYSDNGDLDMATPKYIKLHNVNRLHDTILDVDTGEMVGGYDETIKDKLHRLHDDEPDEDMGKFENRPIVMLAAVMSRGMVNVTFTEHAKGIVTSGEISNPLIFAKIDETMKKAVALVMPDVVFPSGTVH